VIGIERHASLAEESRSVLESLSADNVEIVVGDGSRGLPERAPFEAIAVHATAPGAPRTLLGQLVEDGRLVAPVAGRQADMLTVFERQDDQVISAQIGPCRFVPLVGEEGFGGA
jgi:protein-L-isoaspartate(D-aspartate) O-methyltransferase